MGVSSLPNARINPLSCEFTQFAQWWILVSGTPKSLSYMPDPHLDPILRFPSVRHLSHSWAGGKRGSLTVEEIQHEESLFFT